MANNAAQMVRDERGRFVRKVANVPLRVAKTSALLLKRRWRRGIDRGGERMRPYAAATRRQKRRRGRPTSPANLVNTGRMISDVRTRQTSRSPTKSSAEVYLGTARSARLMDYHTRGAGRLPIRDVWGHTRREEEILRRRFKATSRKRVSRAPTRKASAKIYLTL